MRARRLLAVAVVVVAGLAATAGCGVRKPPRALQETEPSAPPRSLARAEADGSITVHWTRPRSAADGQSLYDLAGFEVERRIGGDDWELIATVAVEDSRRIRPQKTFSHHDTDPHNQAASYRIRAFTADGQRGMSTLPFSVTAADSD